jgi:lipopolysaccharide biosynthesis regulator YciM
MNLVLVLGVALLLLIVGTLLGRYYAPDRRPLMRAAEEGKAYAKGLVELLEGDPDGAIDEITSALKKNAKTVEAYFALGTLFRNRGEYERAVRVHQAILVRRDVDKKTRLRVHQQLALDFKAAGFPRRAVKALEWIVTQDKKRVDTFRELAALYEETAQWERAAGAHKRIARLTGEKGGEHARIQAHLLAQLAGELVDAGKLAEARKQIRRALAANAESVHTLHVFARYQEKRGDHAAAAKLWERCLRLRPNLAAFFAPRLENALFELGRLEQLERILTELVRQHAGNAHLRLAYARFDARRNPERALAELTSLLAEAPGLLPARREAARLVLERNDPGEIRRAFEDMVGLLERADRGYRCEACSHTQQDLFWRCTSCGAWGSVGVQWGRRRGEASDGETSRGAAA